MLAITAYHLIREEFISIVHTKIVIVVYAKNRAGAHRLVDANRRRDTCQSCLGAHVIKKLVILIVAECLHPSVIRVVNVPCTTSERWRR